MFERYLDKEGFVLFSVGVLVGSIYTQLFKSCIHGDFVYVILNLSFILACVLYPTYGDVPTMSIDNSGIIVTACLIVAYLLPYYSVIPLGFLIACDSLDAILETLSNAKVMPTRLMGLSGFIIGRNQLIFEYLDFLIMVGPFVLLVNRLSTDQSASDETKERWRRRIYTRAEFMALRHPLTARPLLGFKNIRAVNTRTISKTRGA